MKLEHSFFRVILFNKIVEPFADLTSIIYQARDINLACLLSKYRSCLRVHVEIPFMFFAAQHMSAQELSALLPLCTFCFAAEHSFFSKFLSFLLKRIREEMKIQTNVRKILVDQFFVWYFCQKNYAAFISISVDKFVMLSMYVLIRKKR